MTREEMIALANQAGMSNLSLIDIGYLEAFANLILEKAAEKLLTIGFKSTGVPAYEYQAEAIRSMRV